jgi:hypothetical protein
MNDLLKPLNATVMDADAREEHIGAIDKTWLDEVDSICADCQHKLLFNACNTQNARCPLDLLAASLSRLRPEVIAEALRY